MNIKWNYIFHVFKSCHEFRFLIFLQDSQQILQWRWSNAWCSTKKEIALVQNFPILCNFYGGFTSFSNDQVGTISLLENVACIQLWNSVLHDVIVWESAALIREKLTLCMLCHLENYTVKPPFGKHPTCKDLMIVEVMVSLRKKMAERTGRQNACVWQTCQGYYLRVLLWSSLNIVSWSFTKRSVKRKVKFGESFF